MAAPGSELPHVDEHSVTVEAAPPAVWEALQHVVERSFSSSRNAPVARALGCRDVRASGPRPLAAGSAFPGFHVATADVPRELALLGRHRFSDYALIFRVEPADGGVRLRAETRAEFPGLHGRLYRSLVIGTGLHVRAVKRLLTAAKRRAERA
jgi:hypothetical protein